MKLSQEQISLLLRFCISHICNFRIYYETDKYNSKIKMKVSWEGKLTNILICPKKIESEPQKVDLKFGNTLRLFLSKAKIWENMILLKIQDFCFFLTLYHLH